MVVLPTDGSGQAVLTPTAAPACLCVAEFSTGMAGAYSGWLLHRMGASVSRIAPPPPTGDDALSLALRFLAEGKAQAIDWDGADIVVIDDLPGFEALAGAKLGALAARHPSTVFGVSSVYGLTGPLAGAPASALDAQAISSTAWVLGEAGRTPLSVPPGVLEFQAGAHLLAACLAARHGGLPDGRGRVVDKRVEDGAHLVGFETYMENQFGEKTATGTATAALPVTGAPPMGSGPPSGPSPVLNGRT